MMPDDADTGSESALFTYGVPFVGVLVVAVGIAAAVPGAYALIQEDLTPCGSPTIAVESPEQPEGNECQHWRYCARGRPSR